MCLETPVVTKKIDTQTDNYSNRIYANADLVGMTFLIVLGKVAGVCLLLLVSSWDI